MKGLTSCQEAERILDSGSDLEILRADCGFFERGTSSKTVADILVKAAKILGVGMVGEGYSDDKFLVDLDNFTHLIRAGGFVVRLNHEDRWGRYDHWVDYRAHLFVSDSDDPYAPII